jgi:peptide/nickel transport system substrate-binding protein
VKKVDKYTVQLTLPVRGDAFLDELGTYKTGGYTLHGRIADGLYGPMHFLKTKHRDFAGDTAAFDKMVKDAGFDAWPLYFKERGDPLRSLEVPVMSPWKLTSPITANIYEWERNPYYYAVDPVGNQLPYMDGISMQLTGDKEVLNLRAIAGEIDFQHRHIEMAKVPVFLENAEKNNYQMRFWPTGGAQAGVTFNITYGIGEPLKYEPDLEIKKWLTNKDFRVAMAMAIDRPRINEVVFLGLGKVKNGTFPKGHPFYPGEDYELKYTTQDIPGANALLDSIGLVDTDGDGIRNRSDGSGNLVFESAYIGEYFLDYESIALLTQEDWAKIGIKVALKAEDVALFSERRAQNVHQILPGGGAGGRDALNFREGHSVWQAYRNWYTGGKDVYASGNPAFDPTGDEMFARIAFLTDEGQTLRYSDRKANYIELQKLLVDNQWVIGIVGDTPAFNGVIVMKNYMKNVPLIAPNQSPLQNPGIGRPQTWYMEGGKNDQ